ncbi:MAG: response regulator [Deltaproteobacteria bacterium]|nr:response regulator [Deltaproteobacteria bacterium]
MTEIRKVLLVDDDEDIRTIGQMALHDVGGLDTFLAAGGEAALEVAAREQPDVILLDVMMPEMDGPTTFRRLREGEATAAIPVVFVTAKVQRHEVQRYLGMGVVGVICKPFDPMTLPDELRRIVTQSQQDQQEQER